MKTKKNFGSIAILAIAIVATVNVNYNAKNNGLLDVMLSDVEALANNETHGGYNSFWDMFTHGLTKDEWSESVQCSRTTGWSINLLIWSYDDKTTINGNMIVCHKGGNVNCYSTPCE